MGGLYVKITVIHKQSYAKLLGTYLNHVAGDGLKDSWIRTLAPS